MITKEDVFAFCGVPDDVKITQGNSVDSLIASTYNEISDRIGRPLEQYDFGNVVLSNGINCSITGRNLTLFGKMRDVFSITSIKENGVELSPWSSQDGSGDYILFNGLGIIERTAIDGWDTSRQSIIIDGSSQCSNREISQAILEIVSIKSGLWKKTIQTEGGSITTEHSLSSPYKIIDKYIQVDIL